MKIVEIRTKTDKEISDEIQKLKRESVNLKFQKATGELTNTARFKVVRRLVAKLKTVQCERTKTAN
jgi:large subunit ribosomal protein L29